MQVLAEDKILALQAEKLIKCNLLMNDEGTAQRQVPVMTPKHHRPAKQGRMYGRLPSAFRMVNLTLAAYPRPHT